MMLSSAALSLLLRVGLRAWPYLAIAALVAAMGGWLYLQGQHAAERKAELANARATIETLQENTRRTAIAMEQATQAARRRDLQTQELKQKLETYEDALKARPDARCILDDNDIGGLRGLQ